MHLSSVIHNIRAFQNHLFVGIIRNYVFLKMHLDFFYRFGIIFTNSGELNKLLAPLYKCAKGRCGLMMSPLPFGAGFLCF